MSENKNSAYEKLTPQRKQLIDKVLENLEKENLLWNQDWVSSGAPESAITGKKYRGVNNFFLTFISMLEGYSDNRWATFKQMEDKGWTFKKDEEGKSLSKGKGVSVEYFEMRDKLTKKSFDRSVLDGMTADEQRSYMDENVYWLRKHYRVFNADLIEGIPAIERQPINEQDKIERAENILDYWNENEAKIIHGGSSAYYNVPTDEIHLPHREDFKTMPGYYSTAFHEIGHSTGKDTRLNRDLGGGFGSESYALEELRAEIASMFLEQDLGIESTEGRVQNNAAYIQAWKNKIKEDPNALFLAIGDADKISKYIIAKEKAKKEERKAEYYAIVEETNAYEEQVYKCYICGEGGTVVPLIAYGFSDMEALEKEINKLEELDFWKDKKFEKVDIEELKEKSKERAEVLSVEQDKSNEYIKPSEEAAKDTPVAAMALPVDMDGRGKESLTRMSDREMLGKAEAFYSKDARFLDLYNGSMVMKTEAKSEYGLMVRLAAFCGNDKEQLMRVFKSSGQFREDKPGSYYDRLASDALLFIADTKKSIAPAQIHSGMSKARQGINAKT